MLMLLQYKFCCLSYMTLLAAILDKLMQYLCELSVVPINTHRNFAIYLTWTAFVIRKQHSIIVCCDGISCAKGELSKSDTKI